MRLDYKKEIESQNIDINKLRPNKSYDYLIENRNSSLKEVISDKEKLKEFLKERNCPMCESKGHSFLFTKDNLDIVKCKRCDCVYVNPIFNEEKYIKIYRSKDYQEIVKKLGEESHNYRKERFGKERVDNIEKFHDSKLPKTMLDIGCSTGFVLEEAKDRRWKATGIELNPSAANFGKERSLDIINKPLEEINFEHKFSAICLYDVLEHLSNPKKILNIVFNLLEKGGNVFIYVPNYNSASKDLLGVEHSHFIWPTHHLTYFTPETLKYFIEQNGLKVLHWETQGLDICDWMWYLNEKTDNDTETIEKNTEALQFYINASGHGKNLRMYAKKV